MLSPGWRLHHPSLRMHGTDQPVRSGSGEGLAAGCCSLIPAAPENNTGLRNVHSGEQRSPAEPLLSPRNTLCLTGCFSLCRCQSCSSPRLVTGRLEHEREKLPA
ncbi:unnamed protein product [Pleuronectes platessa]|uniref:Uncharacterized protein n=1 Tax=Pleuronectes platessa TaxID=8262 RepID=A0A9N7YM57_PLEPL|nr:unnamed protein product [Pleuronectes platessa]